MYVLKLKSEKEEIRIDDHVGHKILLAWREYQQNKVNSQIEVAGIFSNVSDIKNIRYEEKKNNAQSVDYIKEYQTEHKRIAGLTPKEKASRTGFMKLLHYTLTGRMIENESQDFQLKVYKLILKFFQENPNEIHPDPIIFKDLYNADEKFNPTGLGIIERCVQRDVVQGKFYAKV